MNERIEDMTPHQADAVLDDIKRLLDDGRLPVRACLWAIVQRCAQIELRCAQVECDEAQRLRKIVVAVHDAPRIAEILRLRAMLAAGQKLSFDNARTLLVLAEDCMLCGKTDGHHPTCPWPDIKAEKAKA